MKRKELLFALIIALLITGFFFYKIFSGVIPFPGDLLISEYNPWKTYSYLGYNPGSYPNKAQYFDTIRQIYPWKTLSLSLINSGRMPLWNPYNFSGAPLFANSQSAVLYPLNILYLLLGQLKAWGFLIFLQIFLSGVFTYIYSRRIGLGKLGGAFASIAFSASLFQTVFLEYNTIGHVILWLPLILFSVESLIKKMNIFYGFLFAFSIFCAGTAGHLQIFGFIIVFTAIYAVSRIFISNNLFKENLVRLGIFSVLLLFSFGISAVQLFPTFELFANSARVSQSYSFLINTLLIQPYQLILFLSPDIFGNPAARNYLISDTYPGNALYIGFIPFVFSLFSLEYLKKNKLVAFFACASGLLLLLFLRTPLTEILYKANIPLFSTGSPTNAVFLMSFSLSILAGFGIDAWVKNNSKFSYYVSIFIFSIIILIWLAIFTIHPAIIVLNNFIFTTGLAAIFILFFITGNFVKKRKSVVIIIFTLVTIFDLFYFFNKFNPFVKKEIVFPDTKIISFLKTNAGINRFWGYGTANIESNFATQYSIFSPDGYDPLYPKWYGEFLQSSKDGKIHTDFSNISRSDAVIAAGFGESDFATNKNRLKVLDLLGVKYILDRVENGSTEKTFPGDRFNSLSKSDGWQIFENKKSLPRILLAPDYKVVNNKNDFEKTFFDDKFDPSKTILLNKPINNFILNKEGLNEASVSIIKYSPNNILLKTSSSNNSVLFLSDTYYPGWEAEIDGGKTEIYQAFYAFRAIGLPAGKHIVSFSYNPASFAMGKIITIISMIGLFAFCFVIGKKIHEKK